MGQVQISTVESLATELGVSLSDARDFVAGVSIHVNRGMTIEAAIVAHADGWRQVGNALADVCDRESFKAKGRAFVVDTFFGEVTP